MIREAVKKVGDLARREARRAVPAAGRAAAHGVKEFLRRFPEEYAKERKKP